MFENLFKRPKVIVNSHIQAIGLIDYKLKYDELLINYHKIEKELIKNRNCIQQLIFNDVTTMVEENIPTGVDASNLPVPPSSLRYLVAGEEDISWFIHAGKLGAETVIDLLKSNNIIFDANSSVLDFGCGCGRVIRHLKDNQSFKLYGTDCNEFAIKWSRKNLGFASFEVNKLSPPLVYADKSFDLIYAFSIFTHLSETIQLEWISEFKRVLKPSGYILISVHGDTFLESNPILDSAEINLYKQGQLVTKQVENVGSNFCNVFHPQEYVTSFLAKDFKLIQFVAGGAKGNPPQDAYLLQLI